MWSRLAPSASAAKSLICPPQILFLQFNYSLPGPLAANRKDDIPLRRGLSGIVIISGGRQAVDGTKKRAVIPQE